MIHVAGNIVMFPYLRKLRKQQMTYEPFRGSFFSITIIIKTIKTMTKYQFLLKKKKKEN